MATLSVVATPIGNLKDITLRALEVLKGVDFILCEDTRVSGKLLSAYEIKTPMKSYHAHSSMEKHAFILEALREGKNIALISDAGTPTISDPGSFLVAMIQKELPEVMIVAVPGPSAVTAALSISGFPVSDFLFLGFLPHKKGRETLFKEIAYTERTVVFYESPHRIIKTLESLKKNVGERTIALGRELTKMFEEMQKGRPQELLSYFEAHPDKVRGEFVVIISPLSNDQSSLPE